MTPEARLDAFKRAIKQTLTEAEAANKIPDFAGGIAADMLEHNTRRIALDPLLDALGWSFNNRSEEARVVGDTTLFIDYLGIDRETRAAELIFEAKAWNASWIAGKGAYSGRPAAELVAAAVDHINGKSPKTAPLTKEWMERIGQVRDYVTGVKANGGAIAQRAVIGCARWMIIFKDPGKAFITKTIAAEDVLALETGDLVSRSDEIYRLLSIEALKSAPREPIFPDEITLHISNPADIRRLFRATHVTRDVTTDPYAPQPSIYVNAWFIAQRKDGALLTIMPRERPVILPASRNFFDMHLDEMADRSNKLLADLRSAYEAELPDPSPIGAFPNFANGTTSSPVRRDSTGSNYLVATGMEPHFLRSAPTVECVFHSHEVCRQAGVQDDDLPVTLPSYERKSFFATNEPHHCAHRNIKHAKKGVPCPIALFEEKLCCRACTLQDFCWSDAKLRSAPCGVSAPKAA